MAEEDGNSEVKNVGRRKFLRNVGIVAGLGALLFVAGDVAGGGKLLGFGNESSPSRVRKFTPAINFQSYGATASYSYNSLSFQNIPLWKILEPSAKNMYLWSKYANAKALSYIPYYGDLFGTYQNGSTDTADAYMLKLADYLAQDSSELILRVTNNPENYFNFAQPPGDPIGKVIEHLSKTTSGRKNCTIQIDEPNWFYENTANLPDYKSKWSYILNSIFNQDVFSAVIDDKWHFDSNAYGQLLQNLQQAAQQYPQLIQVVTDLRLDTGNIFRDRADPDVYNSWIDIARQNNPNLKIATSIERDSQIDIFTGNRQIYGNRDPHRIVKGISNDIYWKPVDRVVLVEYFADDLSKVLNRDLDVWKPAIGNKELWTWLSDGSYRQMYDININKTEDLVAVLDNQMNNVYNNKNSDGEMVGDFYGMLWSGVYTSISGQPNPIDNGETLETVRKDYAKFAGAVSSNV